MSFFNQNFLQWSNPSINRVTFLPTDISNIEFWYDASDTSTITKASDLVSAWNDKSGQGNNLAQATGTNQPLWVDSVQNGKPVIKFDGVDNFMTGTTVATTQPTTFLIVAKMSVDIFDSETVFDTVSDGATSRQVMGSDFDENILIWYAGISGTYTPLDSTNFKTYNGILNGATSYLRQQGVEVIADFDAGAGVLNGITVGQAYGGSQVGAPWIAEFICYNKTLTAQEIIDIEAYLTNKWGTT